MRKTSIAIVAFGNVGKAVFESVKLSPDMQVSQIFVRRAVGFAGYDLSDIAIVNSLSDIEADVAVITAPSKSIPDITLSLLSRGIRCVDCFDIHSRIAELRSQFDDIAKKSGTAAITAAGWDPGSDSIIRTLLLALSPSGVTHTNFGPGVSMGHTVCVKSKDGVADGLSLTYPKGEGLHRRLVYVKLKEGFSLQEVASEIKKDPYFANDETHVFAADDIDNLKDLGHGVTITRKGTSGRANNQLYSFDMRIDNPALTAQVLVSCARAVLKQNPGCYTMPEIPPLDYIYGDKDKLIRQLV